MISSSVDEDTSYSLNLDGIKKYPSPLRGLSPDGRTSKWEPPGEEFDSRFAKKKYPRPFPFSKHNLGSGLTHKATGHSVWIRTESESFLGLCEKM